MIRQDPSHLETYLRPDFHEWFPVFDSRQLAERLDTMPFHLATLLSTKNMRRALQLAGTRPYLKYLRQDLTTKHDQLMEVLVGCGISEPVAQLVAADRHRFVKVHSRPMAYLDRSPHVWGTTFLTSPSLVSLMLELSLKIDEPGSVCEIGIGSGFHAICQAGLWPTASFVGVERDLVTRGRCHQNLCVAGIRERFTLVGPAETERAVAKAQFVYITAALTLDQRDRLLVHGAPDSYWLMPRQLTREEFESEPAASWLRQRYGRYDGYQVGWWNQYVALDLIHLNAQGQPEPCYTLYDVRFVRYVEG